MLARAAARVRGARDQTQTHQEVTIPTAGQYPCTAVRTHAQPPFIPGRPQWNSGYAGLSIFPYLHTRSVLVRYGVR